MVPIQVSAVSVSSLQNLNKFKVAHPVTRIGFSSIGDVTDEAPRFPNLISANSVIVIIERQVDLPAVGANI